MTTATWIVLIAIGGWTGISDVKYIMTTEAQCKATVATMKPLRQQVGVVCIGPNGETISFDNLE